MAAIEEPAFTWPVRVYYEDTDCGNVVYYANYLRFMERARTEWLRANGIEQDAVRNELKLLFVVVSSNVRYIQPARFNDELFVTVDQVQPRRASVNFEQRVCRGNTVLCQGSIRAASVNAQTLKPIPLPARLLEAIRQ